jgi:hypothetical protein
VKKWNGLDVKLPPPWKIGREAKRVVRQAAGLIPFTVSYFLATPYYDLILSRNIKRFAGELKSQKRVAIYLIFPSRGLLPSHLHGLDYLKQSGFAPLVVSNLPLTDDDRQMLLGNCWQLIERPNYGYDFGGYRDAILSLADTISDLSELALLNDSTWFPLPASRDWLQEARNLSLDFVGAASNYGADRVEIADFDTIEWRYSSTHKNFHHCSFALLISNRILRDRAFLRFWKRFRLSHNKKRTVRRGEIGLTQWVKTHGYAHGDTLDIARLDQELRALDNNRIRSVLERLIVPEDPRLLEAKHAVLRKVNAGAEGWRALAEKMILTAVARQGVSYALADYTTKERGFPFLKKSPVWLNPETSAITLQIARDLAGPFADQIVAEIDSLNRSARNRPSRSVTDTIAQGS